MRPDAKRKLEPDANEVVERLNGIVLSPNSLKKLRTGEVRLNVADGQRPLLNLHLRWKPLAQQPMRWVRVFAMVLTHATVEICLEPFLRVSVQ